VLDERFASASRMVVATVDELVSTEQVTAAGVTIPGHLVAAVVHVPFGAHPASCYPRYAYDRSHLQEYVAAAQSGPEDLDKYLAAYVQDSEESYRGAIGPGRLTQLATWSRSTDAWQELFSAGGAGSSA
jgi:glutaconate CoA-transferase subunit A